MKFSGKNFTFLLTLTIITGVIFISPFAALADCGKCSKCMMGESAGKVMADFRYRTIFNGTDHNGDTDMDNTQAVRSRLGFKVMQGDVKYFLQMQYPATIGWSAGTATNFAVDVHQAYMKVMNCGMEGLHLKVGRFEMAYGDERLIGKVGWSNVGRSFEGLKLRHGTDMYWADVFMTTLTEKSTFNPDSNAKDDLFSGVWAEFKPMKLNVFFLNQRFTTQLPEGGWHSSFARNTFGIHYMNKYDSGLGALVDFAMQMGTSKTFGAPGTAATETDLSGMMFVVAAWYKMETAMKPVIAIGVDRTTGDDPTTNDENEGFSNLYFTGHKWHGAMDYFVADGFMNGTNPGLQDIVVEAYIHPWENGYLSLEFHNFSTIEDYTVSGGGTSTSLGNEIDLAYHRNYRDNLKAEAGFSYFMGHEDWVGPNADNSMWFYIQLSSKFNAFAWGDDHH